MTPDDPPRWQPERPFPSYAFLPGRDPHPTRDPRGHSYSEEPEAPGAYLEAALWRENDEYLFGVDLYNHGYLWEAHESWESLWHQAKHDPPQAEFLQGLIQCTAAALKVTMEQPKGLDRLSELGTGRLDGVAGVASSRYMGLLIPPFTSAFRRFALSGPESAEERPRLELGDS